MPKRGEPNDIVEEVVNALSTIGAWERLSCRDGCNNQVCIIMAMIVGEDQIALGAYCFEHRAILTAGIGLAQGKVKENASKET